MKTIIVRTEKSSRWAAIVLATAVAIVTSAVVANATQTITTPNAVNVPYNLAAGANSAAITPVTNKSVLVMGCCTTYDLGFGAGQVTLQHNPSRGFHWVGFEAYSGGSTTLTSGVSSTTGTHIVYIAYDHGVDIEVAGTDTIFVHNLASVIAAGNVTLIW